MNLALRGGPGIFLLEKWYLDVITDAGAVLIVYLGWLRLLGLPLARVSADLFEPHEGSVARGSAPAHSVRGHGEELLFGPARLDGECLRFETPGLSGDLRFRPRHAPAVPRDPFLGGTGGVITWTVEVPDADVEGELRWPGGGRTLRGRGYRDRVFFDIPPWRLPLTTLEWGRAVGSGHACTWVHAALRAGPPLRAGWSDGVIDSPAAWRPALGPERTLVSAPVADLAALRLGGLGPLLGRLSRNPRATKWLARTEGPGGGGWGLGERVQWS